MSLPKKKDGVNGLIAVAVNNEKESHHAFKWATDNLLTRNANVILIHVKILAPDAEINANDNDNDNYSLLICKEPDADALYMFLPYCVFCTRKDIQCKRVVLEDADVSKALIEYASQVGIEHLILGSSAKTSLHKIFKVTDISGTVSKGAPDFCTVYVIGNGKIQSTRLASRSVPKNFPLQVNQTTITIDQLDTNVGLEQSVKEQERYSFDVNAPGRSWDGIYPFGWNRIRKEYLESASGQEHVSTSQPASQTEFVTKEAFSELVEVIKKKHEKEEADRAKMQQVLDTILAKILNPQEC